MLRCIRSRLQVHNYAPPEEAVKCYMILSKISRNLRKFGKKGQGSEEFIEKIDGICETVTVYQGKACKGEGDAF